MGEAIPKKMAIPEYVNVRTLDGLVHLVFCIEHRGSVSNGTLVCEAVHGVLTWRNWSAEKTSEPVTCLQCLEAR